MLINDNLYTLRKASILTLLLLTTEVISKDCGCQKISKSSVFIQTIQTNRPKNMVLIPAGEFLMGAPKRDLNAKSDEFPQHSVKVNAFYLDETPVTNAQFHEFVSKTRYKTLAERPVDWETLKQQLPAGTPKPPAEQLMPGSLLFSPPTQETKLTNVAAWWRWQTGLNWRHPLDPTKSHLGNDYPVVHIAWFDAEAYCKWRGKRLPTEAEWEWAARGGLNDALYPWGNDDIDTGALKANTWQGTFPTENTLRDHYYWTSPVKSFPPNAYGLYDMAGNVWEWTADLYDTNYYQLLKQTGVAINPSNQQKSYDPEEPTVKKHVLRGGSFLCNRSYCAGYRVSARMKNSPDTSLVNTGFRCAKNL